MLAELQLCMPPSMLHASTRYLPTKEAQTIRRLPSICPRLSLRPGAPSPCVQHVQDMCCYTPVTRTPWPELPTPQHPNQQYNMCTVRSFQRVCYCTVLCTEEGGQGLTEDVRVVGELDSSGLPPEARVLDGEHFSFVVVRVHGEVREEAHRIEELLTWPQVLPSTCTPRSIEPRIGYTDTLQCPLSTYATDC